MVTICVTGNNGHGLSKCDMIIVNSRDVDVGQFKELENSELSINTGLSLIKYLSVYYYIYHCLV